MYHFERDRRNCYCKPLQLDDDTPPASETETSLKVIILFSEDAAVQDDGHQCKASGIQRLFDRRDADSRCWNSSSRYKS